MSVDIPGAGTVGSFFAIPADDWSAINARAAVVVADQGIAAEISHYIPNYPALLAACQQWPAQTFPGILAQAYETNVFATQAAKTLGELATDLAPLKPNDPLPQAITFIFTVQFAALRDSAGTQETTFRDLAGLLTTFVTENATADQALAAIVEELGPAWQPITGPTGALDSALQDVQAGWGNLADAFGAAASSAPTLTTAALLALDLQGVTASWNDVAIAATTFISTVPNPASGS
jgi:hypothetical protein